MNDCDGLRAEIRAELRHIQRLVHVLRQPLDRFVSFPIGPGGAVRHFVDFQDGVVPTDGNRLQIRVKSLSLPDERIQTRFYELTQGIWHLKDRLKQWCRRNGAATDVEEYAEQHPQLILCGDLANFKKHGAGRTRSGLSPRFTTISFDTSENGVIELHYNGATKEKELWVENAVPIPFRASVVDSNENVIEVNGLPVLAAALDHWRPLIQRLGVLDSSDPESEAIARLLSWNVSSPQNDPG